MADIVDRLRAISTAPSREAGAFDIWLEQRDAFAFLKDNLSDPEFVLYVGLPFTFIYAIAVPAASVATIDVDDLFRWSANPWSSWGIWSSLGNLDEVSISSPLENAGSKIISSGEQLIYGRLLMAVRSIRRGILRLCKTNAALICTIPERWAYCRFKAR